MNLPTLKSQVSLFVYISAQLFLVFASSSLAFAGSEIKKTVSEEVITEAQKLVKQNDIESLKQLQKKGLDLNAKDNSGMTLFMTSILHQKTLVRDYLLTQKINLNEKSKNSQTALSLAISNDQPDVAKKLIELGVALEGKCGSKELFVCAITMNDLATAKLIYSKQPELIMQKNENNETALIEAVKYGTTEVVKWLLEQNKIDTQSLSQDGKTALQMAQQAEREELVELLQSKTK